MKQSGNVSLILRRKPTRRRSTTSLAGLSGVAVHPIRVNCLRKFGIDSGSAARWLMTFKLENSTNGCSSSFSDC